MASPQKKQRKFIPSELNARLFNVRPLLPASVERQILTFLPVFWLASEATTVSRGWQQVTQHTLETVTSVLRQEGVNATHLEHIDSLKMRSLRTINLTIARQEFGAGGWLEPIVALAQQQSRLSDVRVVSWTLNQTFGSLDATLNFLLQLPTLQRLEYIPSNQLSLGGRQHRDWSYFHLPLWSVVHAKTSTPTLLDLRLVDLDDRHGYVMSFTQKDVCSVVQSFPNLHTFWFVYDDFNSGSHAALCALTERSTKWRSLLCRLKLPHLQDDNPDDSNDKVLNEVDYERQQTVTDETVAQVLKHSPDLQELYLCNTGVRGGLTDASLDKLASQAPKLSACGEWGGCFTAPGWFGWLAKLKPAEATINLGDGVDMPQFLGLLSTTHAAATVAKLTTLSFNRSETKVAEMDQLLQLTPNLQALRGIDLYDEHCLHGSLLPSAAYKCRLAKPDHCSPFVARVLRHLPSPSSWLLPIGTLLSPGEYRGQRLRGLLLGFTRDTYTVKWIAAAATEHKSNRVHAPVTEQRHRRVFPVCCSDQTHCDSKLLSIPGMLVLYTAGPDKPVEPAVVLPKEAGDADKTSRIACFDETLSNCRYGAGGGRECVVPWSDLRLVWCESCLYT